VHRSVWVAVLSALVSALFGSAAAAATLDPVGTFEQPIFVTSDPSNADRVLVIERAGRVVEVTTGGTRSLADFGSLVSCCNVERGLLSIVPAPDFGSSGRFYAAYTGAPAAGGLTGDVHIDSFRPDPQSAGQVIREPIIDFGHSQFPSHNGGQLHFGPDGYLYISLGDGGGAGDPLENGQDIESPLGKILRIDPRPGQLPSYAIPADNPFVGVPGLDEIWAYGFRNPWRFSFDRASGDMVIADVGQEEREEIDYAPSPSPGVVSGAGANYGWNCREGTIAYPDPSIGCGSLSSFTDPVFDYPHDDPEDGSAHGCSIIGGYVARDPGLGDLLGRYVYADFCTGEVRSLLLPGIAGGQASGDRSEGISVPAGPTSFGEDSCGRLYVTAYDGAVYRLGGALPSRCAAPAQTAAAPAAPTVEPARPLRLRLRAVDAGRRLKIVVRGTPCAGHAGEEVQLNQGGRRIGVKRLDRHCVARFFARVDGRSTFRASLPDTAIRSPRLAVGAPR